MFYTPRIFIGCTRKKSVCIMNKEEFIQYLEYKIPSLSPEEVIVIYNVLSAASIVSNFTEYFKDPTIPTISDHSLLVNVIRQALKEPREKDQENISMEEYVSKSVECFFDLKSKIINL